VRIAARIADGLEKYISTIIRINPTDNLTMIFLWGDLIFDYYLQSLPYKEFILSNPNCESARKPMKGSKTAKSKIAGKESMGGY